MKKLSLIFLCCAFAACQVQTDCAPVSDAADVAVITYPAPIDEVLNSDFRVQVAGKEVPVYNSRVSSEVSSGKADETPADYQNAGFAYFDLVKGPVVVEVGYKTNIRSVRFVSAGKAPVPEFRGNVLKFKVDVPQNLSVIINGDEVHVLDLFVNPEETSVPDPADPEVMFFGPGSYRLPAAVLEDGMTVYVAGGALVRCYVGPHEYHTVNPVTGLKNYEPFYMLDLNGKNIRLCGRGILSMDDTPLNSRRGIRLSGENIKAEGVILRNTSECGLYVDSAVNAEIDNVKVINYRWHSDGLNVNGASELAVRNSFVKSVCPYKADPAATVVTESNVLVSNLE